MATLTGIGSVLTGLGSLVSAGTALAGAFGGGSGYSGKGDWPGRSDKIFNFQRDSIKKAVRWRVEDARAAGIHPLAALGGSIGGGFASPVGGFVPTHVPTGSAIGDAVQGLGEAVSDIGARRDAARAEHEARAAARRAEGRADAVAAAQIDEARSAAALNRARAADTVMQAGRAARTAMIAPTLNARPAAGHGVHDIVPEPSPALGIGFGKGLGSATDIASAQEIEDRYGDIAQEVFGLYKLLNDVIRAMPTSSLGPSSENSPGRNVVDYYGR